MSSYFLFASLPNLITIGRLVLVPAVIIMIVQNNWQIAFLLFLAAGVSDAVDGFLAKRFNLQSELGAFLDPIADKALLISIYVTLAVLKIIPPFIAILVVSRDVMIVGAFIIAWVMDNRMEIHPHIVSKANTTAQIGLAATVLAVRAFDLNIGDWVNYSLYGAVAVLTLASLGVYFVQWLRHMDI